MYIMHLLKVISILNIHLFADQKTQLSISWSVQSVQTSLVQLSQYFILRLST